MAGVRLRVKTAFARKSAGHGTSALLMLVLTLGLLASVAVATAVATCSISSYPTSGTEGTGSQSEPDIYRCYKVNPINCATGNKVETQVDLAVGGSGPSLQMTRTYNSQLAAGQSSPGAFGYGWRGSYSSKLTLSDGDTDATIRHDNGSTTIFTLDGGVWRAPAWVPQATLIQSGGNFIYTEPDHTKLEFDSAGRLLKITDRHNLTLTMTYDMAGRLHYVSDHPTFGRRITFTYNAAGQVEKVTDPMGRAATYAYLNGNLVSVTLPGMAVPRWKFVYNGFHELTGKTNGRGYTTNTTYDSSHRAITQTNPLGHKTTFAYAEVGGVKETTVTKPNGAIELMKFNQAGSPTSVTVGKGTALEATTTYTYNSMFLMTSAKDANGNTTTYTYDSRGNRLTEKDPIGNETKWTYTAANDVLTETSPKGQVTTFTRNAAGDPTAIKRAFGTLSREDKYEYSAAGNLTKHTDPVGRVRLYTYDPVGWGQRLAAYGTSIAPENQLGKWKYNNNSEVIEEVGGRGFESGNTEAAFTTTISRDAQGRPVTTTDPLGGTTTTDYDANGNVSSIKDANGNVTSYVYDAADQRTEVKKASGAIAKTTYNSLGQVATRTNGAGGVREFKRDILGQVTETIDPLGRATAKAYDPAGNLIKVTDALGGTITYTYDAADRPTKTDYSDVATADVTFAYDANGNVTEMVDGTGTTKRTYDALDRPTEVLSGAGQSVKYEYNAAGDVTKLTYPNGKAITRGFDSLGRLASVVDWLGKETTFSYFRNSQIKTTTFPSETTNVDEYAYDARGEMTQVSMKKGAAVLASLSYTRDPAGQVKKIDQTGIAGQPAETVYSYDADDRLLTSNGTTFGYDLASNVTKISSTAYTYDGAGQIATSNTGTFVYNALGQRTKSTPTGGVPTSYTYDQAGHLTSVTTAANGSTPEAKNTFKYDGSGLRTSETKNTSTYPMVWDSTSQLPLLLRKGNDYYIYGPDGLVIEQITVDVPTYLHHDQLGSTRLLTDSTGASVGTYYYGPNGAIWNHTGTRGTMVGFAGENRMHTGTQLIYLRARTYDPVTAQFLTPDPLVDISGEPYSYAANNPVNAIDPTGLVASSVGCETLSDCCPGPCCSAGSLDMFQPAPMIDIYNPPKTVPRGKTRLQKYGPDIVGALISITPIGRAATGARALFIALGKGALSTGAEMGLEAAIDRRGPTSREFYDGGTRTLITTGVDATAALKAPKLSGHPAATAASILFDEIIEQYQDGAGRELK